MSSDEEEAGGVGQGALNVTDDDWKAEEVETLIENVKGKRILYEIQSKENKNSGRKELAWISVSNSIGKDVKSCKAKWKYLRDYYRILTKVGKGKSGKKGKAQKKWEFYESLTFLRDHMAVNQSSTGNIPRSVSESPAPGGDDVNEPGSDDANATTISRSSKGRTDDDKEEPSTKKFKMNEKLDNALLGYLSNAQTQQDSHHHFCMGIADQLRNLPPGGASWAKFKIQQIMYEAENPAPVTYHQPSSSFENDIYSYTNLG